MVLSCVCRELPSYSSKLKESGPATSTSLLDDIKRMQGIDAFSDMVFVCGSEQEEIRACRMLAAARSPVLQSMLLTSGMAESQCMRVSLPDIHPTVMRICLEFFHTDTVQQSSWPNIFMAMHVLKAAMFFLIKPLQILSLVYLDHTLRHTHNKDANWCESLVSSYNLVVELISSHSSNQESIYCRLYQFLCDYRTNARKHLAGCSDVKLFSGFDYERNFYKELSEPALFRFIRVHDYEYVHGLAHYFSFLHVVRWSAYRVVVSKPSFDEGEFEDVLSRCFPRSSQVMRTMLSSAVDIPFDDPDISRCMNLLAGPLADCLKRAPLDFAEMPSQLLCRFIEPLGVVSPSTLLTAYRRQALRRPDLQWDQVAHAAHYILDKYDSTLISCMSLELRGFARCNTYLNAATDLFFDWEVIIYEPCTQLRIGFCACKSTFKHYELSSYVLGDTVLSWALGADGFLYNSGNKSSAAYASAFVKEGVVVQVYLDMVNNSCSFCIDNKDMGVAWGNLPLAGVSGYAWYPAISFVSPGKAGVRMVRHRSIDRPSKRMCFTFEMTSASDVHASAA